MRSSIVRQLSMYRILKAALEVWRYCEDSARLIFESGTGNKHADRILQALKVADGSGMSKTELANDSL
jgi:hypothetical protein